MADELEELNVEPESESPTPAEDAPAETPPSRPEAAGPRPAPAPTSKAFPQLYRFFWGGLLVFVGGLLPFGSHLVTKMLVPEGAAPAATQRVGNQDAAARKAFAENFGTDAEAAVAGSDETAPMLLIAPRPAYHTFLGSLFMVCGLMLMGQMFNCIRDRKIALGGVLVMFFPCSWAWLKLCTIGASLEWFSWVDMYKLENWEYLARDMGSGFVLILVGSTYVAMNFLMAIFGAASGGKKDASAPAAAKRSGASSRRR